MLQAHLDERRGSAAQFEQESARIKQAEGVLEAAKVGHGCLASAPDPVGSAMQCAGNLIHPRKSP